MTRRHLLTLLSLTLALSASARLTVTRITCNYQTGLAVTEGPVSLGWQMTSDINGDCQTARQIIVRERVTDRLITDTGQLSGSESQRVSLPALPYSPMGYTWQVRVWDAAGEPSPWSEKQTIIVAPAEMNATWIGAISSKAARLPQGRWSNSDFKKPEFKAAWAQVDTLSSKSIILRKEFKASHGRIAAATAYVCGLGHYEMTVNGERIGSSELAPAWSEYDKTVYYNVYDVTAQLRKGRNAVGIMLGNGFFNVQRQGRYSKLMTSFGAPRAMLKLVICYADGTVQQVSTDTSWRWALSPVTFNSIYGGESYDARMEQKGVFEPDFNAASWSAAIAVEAPKGRLTPQTVQPVKVMERFGIKSWRRIPADSLPAASKQTKRDISPSAFVCDMGQNLAGFPEIAVCGRRGQKVTLIVAEKLTRQGACDQRQTGRQHYYEYTLKGEGTEVWHPRFSYYGFRYIQVEGAALDGQPNPNGLPVLKRLSSCFIYCSAEEVSSFHCSSQLFTDTHRLIERAERSNMQSVLTDCPHREKLGWLEQDHLCGPSLLYNYDMTRYVPKVIKDITDTQKDNGLVPTTAPQYVSFGNLFDDSPEWGSALIVLPFMYYNAYGDSTVITRNYRAMSRYVDYLTSRADSGIVSHGLGDWYDYGPWRAGFSRNTPVPLVATAHYIMDIQLLARAAAMTGDKSGCRKYQDLYADVVRAFNRKFYNPDSCSYGTGSQTSNALPLFLGITGGNKQKVLQSLVKDIKAHGNRLTTGDVGNRYLFQTLAGNGLDSLLYTMLNHYDTPGYGYQLRHGATTLTEQWNPLQGTSLNHFMLGQIDEWLFKSLGGIRNQPGTHGMRHLLIAPRLVGDLQSISASTASLYGAISVSLTRSALTVAIPVGSDAVVILPDGSRHSVKSGTHRFSY